MTCTDLLAGRQALSSICAIEPDPLDFNHELLCLFRAALQDFTDII